MYTYGLTESECPMIPWATTYSPVCHSGSRYSPNPSQENLISGLRLAQMWNVPRLFHYSLDHFRRQFIAQKIHPAIVLAVARENGIPSLIRPAVESLAKPTASLHSWCCDVAITQYVQVEEISAIARMKERLYNARLAILDVPPVTHGGNCVDTVGCGIVWGHYWNVRVGGKVRKVYDGTLSHQLWFIRSELLTSQIPGMTKSCRVMTVDKVGMNSCWSSNRQIVDGAVGHLMVVERLPDWSGVDSNGNN